MLGPTNSHLLRFGKVFGGFWKPRVTYNFKNKYYQSSVNPHWKMTSWTWKSPAFEHPESDNTCFEVWWQKPLGPKWRVPPNYPPERKKYSLIISFPETNMAPENPWLEDEFPFWGPGSWQVRTVCSFLGSYYDGLPFFRVRKKWREINSQTTPLLPGTNLVVMELWSWESQFKPEWKQRSELNSPSGPTPNGPRKQ